MTARLAQSQAQLERLQAGVKLKATAVVPAQKRKAVDSGGRQLPAKQPRSSWNASATTISASAPAPALAPAPAPAPAPVMHNTYCFDYLQHQRDERSLVDNDNLRVYRLQNENRAALQAQERCASRMEREVLRQTLREERQDNDERRRRDRAEALLKEKQVLQDDEHRRSMERAQFEAEWDLKRQANQMMAEQQERLHLQRMLDKRNQPQLLALTLQQQGLPAPEPAGEQQDDENIDGL